MKTAAVILIFAIVVVGFFYDVLIGDRVLITSNPAHVRPWSRYAGEGDLNGSTYRNDAFYTYLPRRFELSRGLREGRLPLWNPHIFCGTPFLADPQSRVLYPVSVLLTWADPYRAMGCDVAIHFFIALIGMYAFLRAVKASTLGSVAGSFLYAFSSFFFLRMGHPTFIASASYIPFFFYAYERSRSSERKGVVLLVIFLALGYLSGFPQVFLLGVCALAIYALYDSLASLLAGRRGEGLRALRVIAVSGILSSAIVAVQLLPFVEFIRNSVGLGVGPERMSDLHLWDPVFLIRSLFPGFFGNPIEGSNWLPILKQGVHQYNLGFHVYLGAGAIALLVAGLALARQSPVLRRLLIILLLAVGVATSAAVLNAAYRIMPLLGYSQIDRAAVIACFAMAAVGGIAFSHLFSSESSRTPGYYLYVAVPLLTGLIAGGIVLYAGLDGIVADAGARAESLGTVYWLRTSSAKVLDWVRGGEADWLAFEKAQVLRGLVFFGIASLLVVLPAVTGSRVKRWRIMMGVVFLAFLFADLVLVARDYYVSQPGRLMGETEGIGFLRRAQEPGRWRIASLTAPHIVLPVNTGQIFGLYYLDGRATIMPDAHADLLARDTWAEEGRRRLGDSVDVADMRWAHDMGCARLMLAPDAVPGIPVEQYRLIYRGDMVIYENLRALERGFLIPRDECQAVTGGGRPVLKVSSYLMDPRKSSIGRVDMMRYEPEVIEMDVEAGEACTLVFQDTYYPGWRAAVDGKPAAIMRTDLGFRALELDGGRHNVEMTFRPRSLIIGFYIACIGMVLTVVYGTKAKATRRR